MLLHSSRYDLMGLLPNWVILLAIRELRGNLIPFSCFSEFRFLWAIPAFLNISPNQYRGREVWNSPRHFVNPVELYQGAVGTLDVLSFSHFMLITGIQNFKLIGILLRDLLELQIWSFSRSRENSKNIFFEFSRFVVAFSLPFHHFHLTPPLN